MQRCNAARWPFVITDIEYPLRVLIAADWLWWRKGGLAFKLLLTAMLDEFANIDGLFVAQNDIVSTRGQSVTGPDGDETFALVTRDLQTAHDTGTMQVAVVQFVLRYYVVLETI
jgi:hypothetical protein